METGVETFTCKIKNQPYATNIDTRPGLYLITYKTDTSWADAAIIICTKEDPGNAECIFTNLVQSWWRVALSNIDGKIAVTQNSWTTAVVFKIKRVTLY